MGRAVTQCSLTENAPRCHLVLSEKLTGGSSKIPEEVCDCARECESLVGAKKPAMYIVHGTIVVRSQQRKVRWVVCGRLLKHTGT